MTNTEKLHLSEVNFGKGDFKLFIIIWLENFYNESFNGLFGIQYNEGTIESHKVIYGIGINIYYLAQCGLRVFFSRNHNISVYMCIHSRHVYRTEYIICMCVYIIFVVCK